MQLKLCERGKTIVGMKTIKLFWLQQYNYLTGFSTLQQRKQSFNANSYRKLINTGTCGLYEQRKYQNGYFLLSEICKQSKCSSSHVNSALCTGRDLTVGLIGRVLMLYSRCQERWWGKVAIHYELQVQPRVFWSSADEGFPEVAFLCVGFPFSVLDARSSVIIRFVCSRWIQVKFLLFLLREFRMFAWAWGLCALEAVSFTSM